MFYAQSTSIIRAKVRVDLTKNVIFLNYFFNLAKTEIVKVLKIANSADDDVELRVLGCRLTYLLGTNCDQCL